MNRLSKVDRRLTIAAGWIFAGLLLATMCAPGRVEGQWIPPEPLRKVPVLADCQLTRHGIGASLQPNLFFPSGVIYLCPEREREIDAGHPGASRFFLVHEYGHLATRSREEALADEWAARQLSKVPSEQGTLRAVLSFFAGEGDRFDPLYGTGFDRALRVAQAAHISEREWPQKLVAYEKAGEIKRATGTLVTLRMQAGYTNLAQTVLSIDRQPIGVLSNADGERPLAVPKLAPGRHLIQAFEVWLYHAEQSGLKTEVARRLQSECQLESMGKKTIAVELRFDGDTLSIRASELR